MFDKKAYREHLEKFTSGYINVDFKNEIKTYAYCSGCAKKDKEIKRLKQALKLACKGLAAVIDEDEDYTYYEKLVLDKAKKQLEEQK